MIEVSEELKRAFMTDNVEKQFRITFPNGEHETITNESIVANSVSLTESLCSEEKLKFGLCEANVFKATAQCENIKGYEIKVFVDAYYNNETYTVPYGTFTVESCKKKAGTHLRDIEAYTIGINENTSSWDSLEYWKRTQPMLVNEPYKIALSRAFIVQAQCKSLLRFKNEVQSNVIVSLTLKKETKTYKSAEIKYSVHYEANNFTNNLNDIYELTKIDKDKEQEAIKELQKAGVTNSQGIVENVSEWINYNFGYTYSSVSTILKAGNLIKPKMNLGWTYFDGTYTVGNIHVANNLEYGKIQDLLISGFKNWTGNRGWNNYVVLYIPMSIDIYNEEGQIEKTIEIRPADDILFRRYDDIAPYKMNLSSFNRDGVKTLNIGSASTSGYYVKTYDNEVDIGNVLNSYLEYQGLFGKPTRYGTYEVININNNFALYPEDEIYPTDELYPTIGQNYIPLTTTSYKAADYEEYKTHKYGYVRVTYYATDDEKYSITVECDSNYDNVYEMTDNYIFLNKIWTAEQVKTAIMTYFYPNIKDIEYNPANVTIKGLPFVESGDLIKVFADDGTFKTFVFRRTLNGEQSLADTIEALGDERHENADLWIATAGQEEEA